MSDGKKRNWFVRLVRVVICLCLLGAIGIWAAKIWVAPSIVRGMAGSYLGDVWFGTIEIDDVDVNIFGPSYVRGVTLRDNLGRTWLSVPEVRVEAAWDGFIPRLGSVAVGVVNVSPQFVDGQCTVPLKATESAGDPVDIVKIFNDLEEVDMTVGVVRLSAVNEVSPGGGGRRIFPTDRALDGIVLPVELARAISPVSIICPGIGWKGGKLSVAKTLGEIGGDPVSVNLSGGLQDDRSIKFSGKGLLLAPDEALSAAFEVNIERRGKGDFKASLSGKVHAALSGEIRDYRITKATLDVLAANIQPDKFEWLIGPNEMVWLALESSKVEAHIEATVRANMPVAVTGRIDLSGPIGEVRATIEAEGQYTRNKPLEGVAKITGTLCGGDLQADVKAVLRPDAPVQLALEASAEKVKMADLSRILAPDKVMEEGTGKVVVRLAMSGADVESVTGRLAFFLDDAHLWNTPILSALFKHMNLKMDKADIQSRVELTGTTATIVSGQLATMVWAADFEKGGTVDFDGGGVDLYVIFLPVKQTGALLNIVKKFNPLNLLAKEVFRLHVTGDRSDPTITPVPFSDLSKLPTGAMGLLKSVTTSGGQLGGNIFKAITGGGN